MLTEFKNATNTFLYTWGFYVCLGVVGFILLFLIVFYFVYKKKNKNELGENKKIIQSLNLDKEKWISSLGGNDNIVELSATKSRLTAQLKDVSKMNKDELKILGVSNIISMSNKAVLVIQDKAEEILKILK